MVFKKDFLDKIINITSNAAIACYPHLGKKDKVLVDKAAADEMRPYVRGPCLSPLSVS